MSKTTTPIYAELITEAKRRTKRGSPERARLTDLDAATTPRKITARTLARQTIGPDGSEELTRSRRVESNAPGSVFTQDILDAAKGTLR